jgi:hypothetical protein
MLTFSRSLALFAVAVLALFSCKNAVAQQFSASKIGGGLLVSPLTVGRSKDANILTVITKLENPTKGPIAVMLLVPEPVATDSFGGSYRSRKVSGLKYCYVADHAVGTCLGRPTNRFTPSLEEWTVIEPGSSVFLNFDFYARNEPSRGPLVSMTSVIAYRLINPATEATTNESQKRQDIKTAPLSIPPSQVTDAK